MSEPTIRKLDIEDLQNGFLTTLDSLRKASDIDKTKAEEIFKKIDSNPDYMIAVAEIDGKVVGSTTLLIEQKFIHNGGRVGHIEDVVVDKNFQGQKIGEKIMKYLLEIAKKQGCYKTILDCTDDVKPFYEKLGFKQVANELRFDHV
ncbi:glucosamine-phosphate N-acetyltransferase protein [Marine Group I thaumarchaeote SCGC AAA799-E16]|uniref:glucosamine-phosphate N-acetyltransferase n=5 Tax=Marine Group I TaxID=905826 RepID=A0A087S7H0_9ARCH|nr:glucosamine-phosphate N-acetyltransferase protein [Marine Group I thaumarchaeote SCGC AAA799-N04]KER06039.1 glucosamine-phosphate N-acetyltransferase protein [Marine Group I thaumarchaeote SCGC AAA799-E16]KFM16937.1 glucosamine-phosphate N-acetyltransferase protein [Marine Group I thaumarchaeote SCGC AAA799-D11]KFM18628.1 glucosamine-phosphate N-acetyltransferase protein [Marine Group I thaumarchaeote SCGC RSA3]KFM21674.1 glucosamine-phosphate N-acetyltransferase protein [Marine Group I thau